MNTNTHAFSFYKIVAGSLLLAIVVSCSSDPVSEYDNPDDPGRQDVEVITPLGNENFLNQSSDYLFDQERLPTFFINLPENHLAEIDSDPAEEKYVEGSVTFEGETLSPVGIRYKGSIGAFVGCVSGSDWTNPSGRKTCTKLSMKIKFNWLDKDDTFYDVKKLQFHSQNLDKSQMRDRLGYWLFRSMGVPAPRAVHARLVINGEYTGLYSMVEQIDGRFTRQNFNDGTGNLYKEVWPVDSDGRALSEQAYLKNLKTNEEDNPTAEMIRSFGLDIEKTGIANMREVVSRWMDVEEIITYAVVDRAIRVDDGPFHWYCGGGDCSNHNYYWYEQPSARTLHLIPWDLDNAFENIVFDRNPVTPIADDWGEINSDCRPFSYGTFGLAQRSAACDKLTAGWVLFEDEYARIRDDFIRGPLDATVADALIDKWTDQVRDATFEAKTKHTDAISVNQWELALSELKSSLQYVRNQ